MNKREHWSETQDMRRAQRGAFGAWVIWVVGILIVIGAISIAVWGFNVGTSDVKGKGDVIREKNSGKNRIAQQERFQSLNASFEGFLVNLQGARQALAAADEDTKPMRQVDLTGMQQQCVNTAQEFNALTQKVTAKDFIPDDVPQKLDPTLCTQGSN
jgi:preprotein translocase subunit SecF